MESNWRWNVWKYGLQAGDVTLCADVLQVPGTVVYKQELGGGNWRQWWVRVSDGWPYAVIGVTLVLPPSVRFPQGCCFAPD